MLRRVERKKIMRATMNNKHFNIAINNIADTTMFGSFCLKVGYDYATSEPFYKTNRNDMERNLRHRC